MFGKISVLLILAMAALIFNNQPAWACPSPASYRSVVLNSIPKRIPSNAIVLKIQVLDALMLPRNRIVGLRGVVVDEISKVKSGTLINIRSRLGSMCNTWLEQWSSNHDVDEFGKLTGYVVGFSRRNSDGSISLRPLMYQSIEYRKPDNRFSAPRELEINYSPGQAIWHPLVVDAETLGENLARTNELIRQELEKDD